SGLKQRLADVKSTYLIPPSEDTLHQLDLIRAAAKPSLFQDAIPDPINMLADMAQGSLARFGAIREAAEGESVGPQLVVNANDGQWQALSCGTSL
ncbi:hypothetical protein CWC02_20740, partial [Pseudoalteromonas sp. S2721]